MRPNYTVVEDMAAAVPVTICMVGSGCLHTVTGQSDKVFKMMRSLRTNAASFGL